MTHVCQLFTVVQLHVKLLSPPELMRLLCCTHITCNIAMHHVTDFLHVPANIHIGSSLASIKT